jgi:peroxiredoxin Q/BCP
MTNLTEGTLAPDFELPTDGPDRVRLSDLKGKKVVLYFYPKDDTSGCTLEAIDFNRLKSDFESANTLVIGISPDSPVSHIKFKNKHALDLLLASDESRDMLNAYGVWVQKSMYGRKYMGVERSTLLIDQEGMIVRTWPKVKVPGHAADVLAAARAL